MSFGGIVTWEELKHLIESNSIEQLRRSEEVLNKYRAYKEDLKRNNESLFSHLIFNELKWAKREDYLDKLLAIDELPSALKIVPADHRLLGNTQDIQILLNDYPYHFEENVTHLVVWSKVVIKSDPNSELGDISPKTRLIIDRYVKKTFQDELHIPADKILWFRNWTALQSVRSISHLHVIVRDLSEDQFKKVYRKGGVAVDYDGADGDLDVSEYV